MSGEHELASPLFTTHDWDDAVCDEAMVQVVFRLVHDRWCVMPAPLKTARAGSVVRRIDRGPQNRSFGHRRPPAVGAIQRLTRSFLHPRSKLGAGLLILEACSQLVHLFLQGFELFATRRLRDLPLDELGKGRFSCGGGRSDLLA